MSVLLLEFSSQRIATAGEVSWCRVRLCTLNFCCGRAVHELHEMAHRLFIFRTFIFLT